VATDKGSGSGWYDEVEAGEWYVHAVTRWAAMGAAYARAMKAWLELAATYQEEMGRDLARMGRNPMTALETYRAMWERSMAGWSELLPLPERMQRDADLLYERLRREAEGGTERSEDGGESSRGGMRDRRPPPETRGREEAQGGRPPRREPSPKSRSVLGLYAKARADRAATVASPG
jgi:hypothetical protein